MTRTGKYYLKKQFRSMKREKIKHDYNMMHFYERELTGAIDALYYNDCITVEEYDFLQNLRIRISCGRR